MGTCQDVATVADGQADGVQGNVSPSRTEKTLTLLYVWSRQ